MGRRWTGWIFAIAAWIGGCGPTAGDEAVRAAEADLRCRDVAIRNTKLTISSSSACPNRVFLVEGCGFIATYACFDKAAVGACDYKCRQTSSRLAAGQTELGAF